MGDIATHKQPKQFKILNSIECLTYIEKRAITRLLIHCAIRQNLFQKKCASMSTTISFETKLQLRGT